MATVGFIWMVLGALLIFISFLGVIYVTFFLTGDYIIGLMATGALIFVAGLLLRATFKM